MWEVPASRWHLKPPDYRQGSEENQASDVKGVGEGGAREAEKERPPREQEARRGASWKPREDACQVLPRGQWPHLATPRFPVTLAGRGAGEAGGQRRLEPEQGRTGGGGRTRGSELRELMRRVVLQRRARRQGWSRRGTGTQRVFGDETENTGFHADGNAPVERRARMARAGEVGRAGRGGGGGQGSSLGPRRPLGSKGPDGPQMPDPAAVSCRAPSRAGGPPPCSTYIAARLRTLPSEPPTAPPPPGGRCWLQREAELLTGE